MLAGMPRIAYDRLGSGPPILLLHGWPQTRRMWRLVVPALAERFSVVAADLRGYGDSEPPADSNEYDKRSMGQDMFGLMDSLGFAERFLVVGHDRGARVARRMAADHPERLAGAALLDIMPMEWVFEQGEGGYARRYAHWYFMLSRGLAEAAMSAVPRAFAMYQFERSHVPLDPAAVEHYIEMFSRPQSIAASLGDYRSAFEVDRPRWQAEVAEGRLIQAPLLVLWGAEGNLRDAPVLEEWQKRARDVRGHGVPGSGHYIPEEQPQAVIEAVGRFASERDFG
jgi:haloacetate dehalogenase